MHNNKATVATPRGRAWGKTHCTVQPTSALGSILRLKLKPLRSCQYIHSWQVNTCLDLVVTSEPSCSPFVMVRPLTSQDSSRQSGRSPLTAAEFRFIHNLFRPATTRRSTSCTGPTKVSELRPSSITCTASRPSTRRFRQPGISTTRISPTLFSAF